MSNLWVVLVLILIFLMTLFTRGQTVSDPLKGDGSPQAEALRAHVLALEEQGRVRSLKGETNWDDMMIDGAYLISPDGAILTYKKGQILPSMPLKDFRISELIARVYGDCVVVTGLATLEAETPDKKPISMQMRFMNVWRKSERKWKMAVTERTIVTGSVKRPG